MDEIGPYRIIRKIAEGGMAEVFLARQRGIEGLERTVVLKRIQDVYSGNDEFVTMFLDEARLMAVLSHPNLAHVVELGKDSEDSYYLVVEYVRGPTVRELLGAAEERGMRGLPLCEALGIGISIAEALSYVHGRRDEHGRPLRIVHRDLNPSNVVVSYDGAVKVIDFGIAKAATKVHETRTGVVKGTYGYIAPEQLTGMAPTDHRADIFALGVILYEMLLGAHPFDTGQDLDILSRVLSAKYLKPRQAAPGFPVEIERVVTRCLAPHPEGRPEDVRVVIDTLAKYLASIRQIPTMGTIATLASELVPDPDAKVPLGPVPVSRVGPLPKADKGGGSTQRRAPADPTLVKNLPSLADGTLDEATVTYVSQGGPTDFIDLPSVLIAGPDMTPTRMFNPDSAMLLASEAGPTDVYPASNASSPPDESQPSATRPFPLAPASMLASLVTPVSAPPMRTGGGGSPDASAATSARVSPEPVPAESEATPQSPPRRYAAALAIGFAVLLISGVGLGAFIATGWLAGQQGQTAVAEVGPATEGPDVGPTPTTPTTTPMTPTTPTTPVGMDTPAPGTPDPVPIEIAPPTTIEVISTPPGASIALDGQAIGIVTPALVSFPLGAETTWVRVALEGFVTQEIQVNRDAEVARFELTPLEDAGVRAGTGEEVRPQPVRRIRRRNRRR